MHNKMLGHIVIVIAMAYYADSVKVDVSSTTPPTIDKRFFGLDGILGQLFGHHHHQHQSPGPGGSGGFNRPQYPVQQNPQQQTNWQNPNDRGPQLFPSQQQDFDGDSGQFPAQSNFNQGNFNPADNFGSSNQNSDSGTLDGIPQQNGGQMQNPGNQGFQNGGNQGFPNQNGGQMQNPNFGNQGFQNGGNQGFPNQSGGNQGFPNQSGGNQGFQPQNVGNQGFPNENGRPDRIVFQDGSDTPAQIQCVQDCQTTTEYSPVCGSNNITYFNPGRFVCARNCGINVFLDHPGRCFD